MLVQHQQHTLTTSGSRGPIPRFYSELVSQVSLVGQQSYRLSSSHLHRFSLRVGRKRDP